MPCRQRAAQGGDIWEGGETMVVDRWQNDDKIDDIAGELAVILGQVYFSVLRVEPAYNRVLILQSKDRPDSAGTYITGPHI